METGKTQTKCSFMIDIKSGQGATWQGNLKWIEKDETIPFRSVIELLTLMDSAIEAGGKQKSKTK